MIVCHCQNITDHDINAAIDWMRAADRSTLITAGKVRRALGKEAICGGCMTLFLGIMHGNPNFKIPINPRDYLGAHKEQESCKATAKSLNISTARSAVS